jgi:hypothetical protein
VRRATLPVTLLVQAASSAAVIAPTVAAAAAAGSGCSWARPRWACTSRWSTWAPWWPPRPGRCSCGAGGPSSASQLALGLSALGLLLLSGAAAAAGRRWAPWISGLGYGPITPASSQMLARTTDPRHYALVFSIKQTGVPLGGVVAGLLVPPLALGAAPMPALLATAALCLAGAAAAVPLRAALDRTREAAAPWPTLGRRGGTPALSWPAMRGCAAWPRAASCSRWCRSA